MEDRGDVVKLDKLATYADRHADFLSDEIEARKNAKNESYDPLKDLFLQQAAAYESAAGYENEKFKAMEAGDREKVEKLEKMHPCNFRLPQECNLIKKIYLEMEKREKEIIDRSSDLQNYLFNLEYTEVRKLRTRVSNYDVVDNQEAIQRFNNLGNDFIHDVFTVSNYLESNYHPHRDRKELLQLLKDWKVSFEERFVELQAAAEAACRPEFEKIDIVDEKLPVELDNDLGSETESLANEDLIDAETSTDEKTLHDEIALADFDAEIAAAGGSETWREVEGEDENL